MRSFIAYVLTSIATVGLSLAWGGDGMGIAGFFAVFLCQPWLALGWGAASIGLVKHLPDISPGWIALFCSINSIVWFMLLWRNNRERAEK